MSYRLVIRFLIQKYLTNLGLKFSDNNLAEFPLFSQFFCPFLHRSPGFLQPLSHVSAYSSCPPFSDDGRPSWVSNHWIVGKRGMPCSSQRFGAQRNCRDFMRSCVLSLGDEHLTGIYFWLVYISSRYAPVHDVLPRLCSCHSTEETHLRLRDEDMAELVFFITQHPFFFQVSSIQLICTNFKR